MNILALFRLAPMALVATGGFSTTIAAQDIPVIAAAADLQFALEEVAAQFKADTGREVRLIFDASGELAWQLQHEAPFEMFMSDNEGYVQKLADAGLTLNGGSGTMYAEGRIVLFAPKGSALKVDDKLNDLRAALADGRIQRFAIAN
jgi:molybdate transport system substrate-binding protein